MIVRIHNIKTVNDFTISIKEGESAYPLDSGFILYNGQYPSTTTEIDLNLFPFEQDKQYWIKLTDIITGKNIIENIKINNIVKYIDCFNV
jgi:hypothetical protein